MLILYTPLNTSWSTGLINCYLCVLASTLAWIFLVAFLCILPFLYKHISEYYCLNIIVNINSFSISDITVNTIMDIILSTSFFVPIQVLNKKLKLMGGAMIFFFRKSYWEGLKQSGKLTWNGLIKWWIMFNICLAKCKLWICINLYIWICKVDWRQQWLNETGLPQNICS